MTAMGGWTNTFVIVKGSSGAGLGFFGGESVPAGSRVELICALSIDGWIRERAAIAFLEASSIKLTNSDIMVAFVEAPARLKDVPFHPVCEG